MNRLSFSDDMMRALAAGEKCMTRRPEKRAVPPESFRMIEGPAIVEISAGEVFASDDPGWLRPRFKVGDLVAATCAYAPVTMFDDRGARMMSTMFRFEAVGEHASMKFKIARIMPAALAPFVLRITAVRAERLGGITDEDAVREGMMHWARATRTIPEVEQIRPQSFFWDYWRKLYGPGSWERDRDRWVWCYSFEIEERRIG
jgi:hypothetical protein